MNTQKLYQDDLLKAIAVQPSSVLTFSLNCLKSKVWQILVFARQSISPIKYYFWELLLVYIFIRNFRIFLGPKSNSSIFYSVIAKVWFLKCNNYLYCSKVTDNSTPNSISKHGDLRINLKPWKIKGNILAIIGCKTKCNRIYTTW